MMTDVTDAELGSEGVGLRYYTGDVWLCTEIKTFAIEKCDSTNCRDD